MVSSAIDGSIKINNKVIGNAKLRLQLPTSILVGKENHKNAQYGDILYDDMNFNSKIDLEEWERGHRLVLSPDKGSSILMNYRSTTAFRQPIVVLPNIKQEDDYKFEIFLKCSSLIPEGTKVRELCISMNIPSNLSGCKVELPKEVQGQIAEYSEVKKKIMWYIRNYTAPEEHYLHIIITLTKPSTPFTFKEMSPINVNYVMVNFNLSQLRVHGLEVTSDDDTIPVQKYLRYISRSGSYVTRF